jgi:hypothetical protein
MESINETTPFTAAPVGILEFETEQQDARKDEARSVNTMPPPSVLAVPTDAHYSRYSGLFHCSIVEEKNKYIMFYQLPNGQEIPVLMAGKQKTLHVVPKYHIFDISRTEGGRHVPLTKSDPQYLGKVRRDKNLLIHGFSLSSEREGPLASQILYILYQLPSMKSVILRCEPPRKAEVALYHEESDNGARGNTLSESVAASMKATAFLDLVADRGSGLYTFSNKEPYKKSNGEFALNFYGRCKSSNSANMQIEDEHGRVIVQLCQWEDKKFHIDFRSVGSP